MRTTPPDSGQPERVEGGWPELHDGLVAGLHHALNNRLAALSAVGQVVEADLAAEHPLSGSLRAELRRLESTVSLLGLLVAGSGDPEPVHLPTALHEARQLLALHHSLRDVLLEVEVDDSLLPVWIDPAALLRALLGLLAAVGSRAGGDASRLRIEARGDQESVRIDVGARGAAAGADAAATRIGTAWVEAILRRAGGRLEVADAAGALTLSATLPTLPEVRRRESQDGS
jgi:C4-dicarboxylate-specific signal transduction histidine kinase